MKYLFFVSFVLVVTGCAPVARPFVTSDIACFKSAVPSFTSTLYDASIDVTGHYISGLLFVKRMSDQSHRVVFTNEAGLTFFDFEWNVQGDFKPKYVIKKLNKKIVINALRKDLELLVVPAPFKATTGAPEKGEFARFTTSSCQSIELAEVIKNKTKLAEAVFLPVGKNVPDSVRISHSNFDMKIVLKRIER